MKVLDLVVGAYYTLPNGKMVLANVRTNGLWDLWNPDDEFWLVVTPEGELHDRPMRQGVWVDWTQPTGWTVEDLTPCVVEDTEPEEINRIPLADERFNVMAVVRNFEHNGAQYDNVAMFLFKSLARGESLLEHRVAELFTAEETSALTAWLLSTFGRSVSTVLVEAVDSLASNAVPFLYMSRDRHRDFYCLNGHPNYNLPFAVWGFFDVGNEEVRGEGE